MIRKLSLEESIVLNYVNKEMSKEYEDIPPNDMDEMTLKDIKKIEQSIFNAKVVNFHELALLFEEEEIKPVLRKCTIFRHGRYILSNTYYEENLHNIRNQILDVFETKEKIVIKDVEAFIKGEYFLLDELCVKSDGFFCLKGFREKEENLENDMGGKEKSVLEIIRAFQPCSVETIRNENALKTEEIMEIICRLNVVEVSNERYVIYEGNEYRRKIIDLLKKRKKFRSSDVTRIAQSGEFGDIEEFFSVFEEYCVLNGSMWSIKE
jgi:uncharacterized protein YfkK (UPF0435 family)